METFDLTVIGSGPGGYVAAIKASQVGMKAALVERDRLGGVCLNWGCIPTKALLKSAEYWNFLQDSSSYGLAVGSPSPDWPAIIHRSRDAAGKLSRGVTSLVKKNKIALHKGEARFVTPGRIEVRAADGATSEISSKRVIIATGARPSTIPGVTLDGKKVISSKEAMVLDSAPSSMTIIGAGAIGLEFAYFYSTFGTEVTIVEYLDRILPTGDEDLCNQLTRAFKKRGIKIHASSRVTGVSATADGTRTTFEADGKETTVDAEITLVAVGIRANTEDVGLDQIGVQTERGFIKVDEHQRTNVSGVYAIGDVCGQPALAHVASAEGIHAVEHMAGLDPTPIDYSNVPACVYCHPQVASVGLTEKQARETGKEIQVGRFPFAASGKAVAVGETEGFVKVIADARFGEILGVHIIGPEATELIAEMALAKASELTIEDVHRTIHAHPTLAETLMEAAGDWGGHAIHI